MSARPRQPWVDTSIIALAVAGAATFIDVYATQPLLPYLRSVFHATEIQVSLTMGALTLAIALVAPFVGLFSESIGRKKVIVPAIFGLCAATLLTATATTLRALIFWRFVEGLFVPGIIAVAIAYINEEYRERGVGRAMGAYVGGTVAGGFLGRLLSGLVATHFHWRASFVVLGLLTLLGGFAVRRWLPKAQHFVRQPDLRAGLRLALGHTRNSRLLAVFLMGFTVLFQLVGVFTYVGFYLAAEPFRLNSAQLGSIFFVYLLGLVVTPLSGRFMDRTGFLRTVVLAVAMACVGLAATLAHSLPLIILGLAVFSSGGFVMQAAATTQTGRVVDAAHSSAAGLYVTVYYIGGSLGAVLPAYMWRHHGWPGCVLLFIVTSLLTLALASATERRAEAAA